MTDVHLPSRRARSHARNRGRVHLGLVLLLILGLLVGAGIIAGAVVLPRQDRIAQGVTIRGRPLGGVTTDEARRTIEEAMQALIDRQVALTIGREQRAMPLSALGIATDVPRTLEAAQAVGRRGALFTRVLDAARARSSGVALSPQFQFETATAQDAVQALATAVNVPPIDATARWDAAAQRVLVTPDRQGGALDAKATLALLRDDLLAGLNDDARLPAALALPYRVKAPRVTAEALRAIDTVLGSYTTAYATSTGNRANNVETAARSINGTVLLPGDEFSFNTVVGPRTVAEGFRTAPVIVNGQLQPGVGGGICQVSTTLYNATLLAGLRITQRSHHSLPVHYAPAGQDATVSYGALDFRFANSTDAPVIVETAAAKRRLTIRVLGKGPKPVIHIERSGLATLPGRTVTKKDPTLPAGVQQVEQKGSSGLRVTVTRVFGTGSTARREVLSTDRYLGEARVVRVGTGTAPAPPADTPTPEPEPEPEPQ